MGALDSITRTMASGRAIAMLCAIALATTLASEIVPESNMIEASEHAEAQAQVGALLAAGKSDTACRNLVKTSIGQIKGDVKEKQNLLNALPTGKNCKNKGQEAVEKA